MCFSYKLLFLTGLQEKCFSIAQIANHKQLLAFNPSFDRTEFVKK